PEELPALTVCSRVALDLTAGWGAQVRGKFILKKGEVLKILIGQEGTRDFVDPRRAGGGGGGTFVVRSNGKPLLIAGGGGGGGIPPPAAFQTKGEGGRTKDIRSKTDTSSGVQGRGGKLFDTDTSKLINVATGNHKVIAGAGGGFNSDGVGFYKNWGGKSFVHGGVGGEATPKYTKFDHGTRGEGGVRRWGCSWVAAWCWWWVFRRRACLGVGWCAAKGRKLVLLLEEAHSTK
ncbi:hypothetical protein QZH41_008732, partial [Actinostola sp. cb2023]